MSTLLGRMRPYFRQVAGELALGSACGALMNTAVVLPAILLGRAVDEAVALARGEGSAEAVAWAALLVVLGTLATELPRIGKRWWLITANARIRANVRADAFRGVLGWPMARLHRTPIGDLMARIVGDVEVLGVGVRELTIEALDTVLFSVSLVVAMALYDAGLTALALLPVPISLVLSHAAGRWVAERTQAAREANAALTVVIQEQMAGARVLRLFGRRASAVERVAALSARQVRANLALVRLRTGLQPAYSTLVTAGVVLVVWQGGERVAAGAMTLGAFVAYLELFARFVGRAHRLPQLVNSVQAGAAAYARLEPLLAPPLGVAGEPPLASFQPGRVAGLDADVPPPRAARPGPLSVALRAATFRYPGAAEPAFRDVDLVVPPGALVAITGPVGSGKSALARCLAGVYPPDAGEVLLDGEPAVATAPGRVGYAPQEGYLFSGTVAENVYLGRPEPPATTPAALDRLVRLAGLEADLVALPHGSQTQIGELGVRVSGGQRQRIGLARALAARSPRVPGLLVLDDPFSAVDVVTEARIVAHLRGALGSEAPPDQRATIVLVSHRLGAFPLADLVVVLEHGRVVEQGPHDALMRAGGLYARTYRAQQRVEGGVPAGARA